MQRMFRRFLITGFLALIGSAAGYHAHAQVNPFNPDYAWCNVRGSVAIRGAAAWQCLLPGTAGQVLQSGGAGANPSWLTVSGAGTVTSVGLTVPSFMTVSNSPITSAGNIALGFASGAANNIFATPNGSAGAPSPRAMVAADMPNAGGFTGVISGTFPGTILNNGVVSNSKMAAMPAFTVKGNPSAASATPVDTTISALIDASYPAATGDLLYRTAAGWNVLSPGASNTYLRSNGAGADLSWNDPSGGVAPGTVTSITCNNGLTGGTISTSGTCSADFPAFTDAIPGKLASASTAGKIGETITGAGYNALVASAATYAQVSITQGNWMFFARAQFGGSATAQFTKIYCSLSTNSTADPSTTVSSSSDSVIVPANTPVTASNAGPTLNMNLVYYRSSAQTYYLRCAAPGLVGTWSSSNAEIVAVRYR